MKWIKHDTDANQDAKLQNVLLDYGLEGYGLYWYCIELIAGKVDQDNITFELEHDARIIARNTGSTAQKVTEMMRAFVSLGLFESSNDTITCMKLARRLDKSMTSNPQMRGIIEQLKNHDSIMTQSEKVMQDKIRLEENRLDKNITTVVDKPTPKQSRFVKPKLQEVSDYCKSRSNTVDPNRFYDHYESNGWKVGRSSMKDWKAAVRTWERNSVQGKANETDNRTGKQELIEATTGASRNDW